MILLLGIAVIAWGLWTLSLRATFVLVGLQAFGIGHDLGLHWVSTLLLVAVAIGAFGFLLNRVHEEAAVSQPAKVFEIVLIGGAPFAIGVNIVYAIMRSSDDPATFIEAGFCSLAVGLVMGIAAYRAYLRDLAEVDVPPPTTEPLKL